MKKKFDYQRISDDGKTLFFDFPARIPRRKFMKIAERYWIEAHKNKLWSHGECLVILDFMRCLEEELKP